MGEGQLEEDFIVLVPWIVRDTVESERDHGGLFPPRSSSHHPWSVRFARRAGFPASRPEGDGSG